MISGEVRESAHPTMMANGCCPCAVAARRSATGWPALTLLLANRSFPAFKRLRASSAGTDGVVGSAAIAQPLRATVVSKMRLRRFSFIVEEQIGKPFRKQAMLSDRNPDEGECGEGGVTPQKNQEAGPKPVGVNAGMACLERFLSAQRCN